MFLTIIVKICAFYWRRIFDLTVFSWSTSFWQKICPEIHRNITIWKVLHDFLLEKSSPWDNKSCKLWWISEFPRASQLTYWNLAEGLIQIHGTDIFHIYYSVYLCSMCGMFGIGNLSFTVIWFLINLMLPSHFVTGTKCDLLGHILSPLVVAILQHHINFLIYSQLHFYRERKWINSV